eukprot:scaffold14201_cov161-Isochrysis_galbana.AAC.1
MKLTIAWGAPSAGVAKKMRMAWCLRAAGPAHAAEGAALGGESSFSGGEGAVDDVFEVSVYVPWREEGGVTTGS